jgi:hypothetical protein
MSGRLSSAVPDDGIRLEVELIWEYLFTRPSPIFGGAISMLTINSSTGSLKEMLNSDDMTRLNVLSLLAQGGYALKNGNKQRAALLFGTAMIASRHKRASYAIRGALAVNDLRKKFS